MTTTIQKQILVGALSFFGDDPHKWLKNNLYNVEKTKACLLGGIILSSERLGINPSIIRHGGNDAHREIYLKAWNLIDQLAEARGFTGIPGFNNDSRTTFEDIKSVLEEAIETVDA